LGAASACLKVFWFFFSKKNTLPLSLATSGRTRPKGHADPGWVEISWEQALDETAAAVDSCQAALDL